MDYLNEIHQIIEAEKNNDLGKALEICNKIIEANPINLNLYLKKGAILTNLKKIEEANKEFTHVIEKDNTNILAYELRGLNYSVLKQYKNTINDLSKVIELGKPQYKYYLLRALAYRQIGDFDSVLKDALEAKKINNSDWVVFRILGDVYTRIGKYHEAIDSYSQLLILYSNYPEKNGIIYNRGRLYMEIHDYDNAIADFLRIIEKDNGDSKFELMDDLKFLIGEANLGKKNIYPATEYFYEARKDIIQAFIAKEYFDNFAGKIDLNILELSYDLATEVNSLNLHLFEATSNHDSFCHYTGTSTLDKLAFIENNTLRYYNAVYMNDPSEGNVIFKLFSGKVKSLFDGSNLNNENSIYIGSFLPSSFSDNLVMWRTYGKECGNEASGCSIKLKNEFFDSKLTSFYRGITDIKSNSELSDSNGFSNSIDIKEKQKSTEDEGFILRKVLYCSSSGEIKNDDSGIATNYVNKISKIIDSLLDSHKGNSEESQKFILRIVRRAISDIQYLFKSEEYGYENEFRVVKVFSADNSKVQIDDIANPKKIFINANRIVKDYITEITLGPKVNHKSEWLAVYTKFQKEKKDISFKNSNIDFQ